MPFVAQNRHSKERIDITTFEDPKSQLKEIDLECRFCGTKMFIRKSPQGTHHFYHQRSCTSKLKGHPESPEHLSGKDFIANYFAPNLNGWANFVALMEEPLKEVNRIVDVLFKFPMGWGWAHEIQLSPISINDLQERTSDYLKNGVDVIWWFGKNANCEENRKWNTKRLGFSPYLKFEDEKVIEYGYWSYRWEKNYWGKAEERLLPTKFSLENDLDWNNIIYKLGDIWARTAFARYFETWGKGNNNRFKRALNANQKQYLPSQAKLELVKIHWFINKTIIGL